MCIILLRVISEHFDKDENSACFLYHICICEHRYLLVDHMCVSSCVPEQMLGRENGGEVRQAPQIVALICLMMGTVSVIL